LTITVDYFGWLERFETAGLDVFTILQSQHDPTNIVIVAITDDDYRTLFHNSSPLDPQVLSRIIDGIAVGQPVVVGVDLDTSGNSFERFNSSTDWPPVVWAEDARQQGHDLIPVLSNALDNARPGADTTGLAQVPEDSDGVVRRYVREFSSGNMRVKSFPWAVVEACARARPSLCGDSTHLLSLPLEGGLYLNFAGERYNFAFLSAGDVLKIAGEDGWKTNGPLKGRIALLGGSYSAGRDRYVTPVGQMSGVQLNAQAIESELKGGGIRAFNKVSAICLEIVCGFVLVSVHYRFRHVALMPLWIVLGSFPLFCLCSYIAFSTLSRWVNFFPMLLGIMIHELHDHQITYRKLLRENESLRIQLERVADCQNEAPEQKS
jgi:CHASE2 domain-containing sensor protein